MLLAATSAEQRRCSDCSRRRPSGPRAIEVGEFIDARLRQPRADDPRVPESAAASSRARWTATTLRRRRRGDRSGRAPDERPVGRGRGGDHRGGGAEQRPHPQRSRGDGLLGRGARTVGARRSCSRASRNRRQRRGDRGRHRARRIAAAQRRRPVHARRVGGGPRRLGRAHAARDRAAVGRSRASTAGAATSTSSPGPGLVNIYQFTHDAFGSRDYIIAGGVRAGAHCAPASARSTIPRICRRRSAARRCRGAARRASRRSSCS